MKQSRLMALVESLANVLVGYGVAVITQVLVFPMFGLAVTIAENLLIGLVLLACPSFAVTRCAGALRPCVCVKLPEIPRRFRSESQNQPGKACRAGCRSPC